MPHERTEFDYLLNAFESASQHAEPATQDYAEKRAAVFAYVRKLESIRALARNVVDAATPLVGALHTSASPHRPAPVGAVASTVGRQGAAHE